MDVGGRALDILIVLTEQAGDLVGKDEIVRRVWPNLVVEEGNLRTQMGILRRALGDGKRGARYIVTVPGRGYRFVAPIEASERPPAAGHVPDASGAIAPRGASHVPFAAYPVGNLPVRLSRPIGRAETVRDLIGRLQRRRFITIVGPGGIGKTTVALAVAEELAATYPDGVSFVDFTSIVDPLLVSNVLATALGLSVSAADPLPEIIGFLQSKRMLVVFDCCERVIEAAAVIAERVLKGASAVHLLATSREPLRAEGEVIQRLQPLQTPPAAGRISASEALTFSAVALFVERVAAHIEGFELTDADAPIVADICRKLDGIALAIELAAARTYAFGIAGVSAGLDDRFRMLISGRRTALPRHQTLRAMLDWSYEILSPLESAVLRRLAIFVGSFTLDACCDVCADGRITRADIMDAIAGLLSKSLVNAVAKGAPGTYRLLDTTRAYALEKLRDSAELGEMANQHGHHLLKLLDGAALAGAAPLEAGSQGKLTEHAAEIGSALDMNFAPGGDPSLGVRLVVAAIPVWSQLSLFGELRRQVDRALARTQTGTTRTQRQEMQLLAALGSALVYSAGNKADAEAAWSGALAIAEQLGDQEYQLRVLWGLWSDHLNGGQLGVAFKVGERFRRVAQEAADSRSILMGERLAGITLFYLGDYPGARRHLERMLEQYASAQDGSYLVRFRFDPCVATRSLLALILWSQGLADEATRAAQQAIQEASVLDHGLSVLLALERACHVAMLRGDLDEADGLLDRLLERAPQSAADPFQIRGRCLAGMLLTRRGDAEGGVRTLRAALQDFPKQEFQTRFLLVRAQLAAALGLMGKVSEALCVIEAVLTEAQEQEEGAHMAEFVWISGEVLRSGGDIAAADERFRTALECARKQGVLAWELRVTASLAMIWRDQGRIGPAREALRAVYERFTEGFATADLVNAHRLIRDLEAAPA